MIFAIPFSLYVCSRFAFKEVTCLFAQKVPCPRRSLSSKFSWSTGIFENTIASQMTSGLAATRHRGRCFKPRPRTHLASSRKSSRGPTTCTTCTRLNRARFRRLWSNPLVGPFFCYLLCGQKVAPKAAGKRKICQNF